MAATSRPTAVLARLTAGLALASGLVSPQAWGDYAPPTPSTPPELLAEARLAFRRAACLDAAPWLSDILYPTPRLARTNDLIEAHVLLGACRLQGGDVAAARREFEEALFLDRATELDPLIFSGEAVTFFRETKLALAERERQAAEARQLADDRERLRKFRESLVFVERRSFAVNFVPLGAGQFQNKHKTKAMISFVGQAVTASASVGLWGYLANKYGRDGNVPPDDARRVRTMQGVGIGLATTFWALYAWSVVDAMVHYKPQVQVKADESWLDDAVPPTPTRVKKAIARPPRSRALVPITSLRQGSGPIAGIGVAWER